MPAAPRDAGRGFPAGRCRGSGRRGRGNRQCSGTSRRCDTQTSHWWTSLSDSCPICLVPLAELNQPPFGLVADASAVDEPRNASVTHFFDSRFLLHWLVSSGDLSDPVNRRPLTRAECVDLDEHVRFYHPELEAVSVIDAFDLQARQIAPRGDREAQPEAQTLQREANSVLQSLFQWRRHQEADAAGHRVMFHQGGLRVVDDDDLVEEFVHPLGNETWSQNAATSFPPLSDASNDPHTAAMAEDRHTSWPCPGPRPSPKESRAPKTSPEYASACDMDGAEVPQRRPRLQLKPRSKDLPKPGMSSSSDAVFGGARPREETLSEAGRDSASLEGERVFSGSSNLCVFSRGVLADLVSGEQQVRTRVLPDIERNLDAFLADPAQRSTELGPVSGACILAVRELCDHCLLDFEAIGGLGGADEPRHLRLRKTAHSRKPSTWLTRAIGHAAHLVHRPDFPRSQQSHDYSVLLSFTGPEGRGTGLDEVMDRFAKSSDFDGPFLLTGGRHVLLQFARRVAAQRCCGIGRVGPWAAQWWSGDLQWAEWQLRQSRPSQTKVATSASVAASSGPQRPLPIATQAAGLVAPAGGQWAALLSDEED